MELPHQKADVSREDFQFLEDLATGFWYSEVLFTVLDLKICELLAEAPHSPEELAGATGCDLDGLSRLLAAVGSLGIIVENNGKYENAPMAARFLVPGTGTYVGDFLSYRRYLVPHWQRLTSRVRWGERANDRTVDETQEGYLGRVFDYVRAMDVQARIKAGEALERIQEISSLRPRRILDLGGGAGAWCREFLGAWPDAHAVLLDLPEALLAARRLYPNTASWEGIELVGGNGLTPCFRGRPFDLVLLSNILHAYGKDEAKQLVKDVVACLAPGGTVLVHDYIADQHGASPLRGRLYDLHMMLNTYNGRVYRLDELLEMLDEAGLECSRLLHLETDTSILLAERSGTGNPRPMTHRGPLEARARKVGFDFARVIVTGDITVEPWVRLKCRFGCSRHDSSLTCPPFSPDEAKMKEIIAAYTHALLVQGTPPSREFHDRLLAIERLLFLDGRHEALAFGAGPCPVCPGGCPPEGRCRFPEMARPSLESCGVDVYETARRAGLYIEPVKHRRGYVKLTGLVLFNMERKHANSFGPGGLNP